MCCANLHQIIAQLRISMQSVSIFQLIVLVLRTSALRFFLTALIGIIFRDLAVINPL